MARSAAAASPTGSLQTFPNSGLWGGFSSSLTERWEAEMLKHQSGFHPKHWIVESTVSFFLSPINETAGGPITDLQCMPINVWKDAMMIEHRVWWQPSSGLWFQPSASGDGQHQMVFWWKITLLSLRSLWATLVQKICLMLVFLLVATDDIILVMDSCRCKSNS